MSWYKDTIPAIDNRSLDAMVVADRIKADYAARRIELPEAYWRLVISQAVFVSRNFTGLAFDEIAKTISGTTKTPVQDLLPSVLHESLYKPLMLAAGRAATHAGTQIRMEAIQASVLWSWGYGKGVYDIDKTVADSVIDTDITEVPQAQLQYMPYKALYISNRVGDFEGCFFTRIDIPSSKQTALSFLMVKERWPFRKSHEADFVAGTLDMSLDKNIATAFDGAAPDDHDAFKAYINMLLLLCCKNVSITGFSTTTPGPSVDKKSNELLVTPGPRHWNVASREGAALRAVFAQADAAEGQAGERGGPRAHVRRAHWHSFWHGPLNSSERKLVMHWIAPVLVGAMEDQVTTHHKVA